MAVNEQDFKNALRMWASGVTVVTSKADGQAPKGMTATSFSSVSMDPPQILVCINQKADTGELIQDCKHFAVNILNTDQQAVSNQFAGGSSQEERFASIAWHEGDHNSPVLEDALAVIECKLEQQVQAGSHWIMVGNVEKVTCKEGDPLLYFDGAYRELIHS